MAVAQSSITIALRRQSGRGPAVFLYTALSLAALVLVPCLLIVLARAFDGLYGQDAFGYATYGGGPLLAALREGRLPPDFFFPPGYPLLIAAPALLGLSPDGVALGWSLLSGASVPVLVFAIAYTLAPVPNGVSRWATGVLAGATAALTGQLWQSSVVSMSDTPALAFATAGALATARYVESRASRWLVVAACLLAAAVEIRLVYGVVVVAVGLPSLFEASRSLPRRRVVLDYGLGFLAGAIVLLPTWLPVALALLSGASVPFLGELWVHSWDPLNATRNVFDTADGRLSYALPMAAFYGGQLFAPFWFLALGLMIAPGVVAVVRNATTMRVGILLAWPVLVIGFLIGDNYQNTRFFLAALPPLAVLIAAGSASAWQWARGRSPIGGRLLAVALVAALVINGGLAARFTVNFIDRVSDDTRAIRSLAAEVPADARLLTLSAGPLLAHDQRGNVVELTALSPTSAVQVVSEGPESYLLVDFESLRSQWAGRAPGQAVDAIAQVAALDLVAKAGIWSLFRVRLLI